ncbi:helix-turn-helix domain-containing protein [uncultured Oscillibacter sp.]|uniref:helix-turn-helix domain-containing protein n=1 Tax=uncultured Oscillibacter sp. TaxID=876091 RepID=UPI0025F0FC95|nr:helix-turn-helix domain-containing protein [uncultured Oscillibacter sp.]
MDVARVMCISRNKAYEVVHSRDFPSFKVGKQYRVSRDKFLSWLSTASDQKMEIA